MFCYHSNCDFCVALMWNRLLVRGQRPGQDFDIQPQEWARYEGNQVRTAVSGSFISFYQSS